MSREFERTIGFAVVIAMGCGVANAAAQTDKYPRMAGMSAGRSNCRSKLPASHSMPGCLT